MWQYLWNFFWLLTLFGTKNCFQNSSTKIFSVPNLNATTKTIYLIWHTIEINLFMAWNRKKASCPLVKYVTTHEPGISILLVQVSQRREGLWFTMKFWRRKKFSTLYANTLIWSCNKPFCANYKGRFQNEKLSWLGGSSMTWFSIEKNKYGL